MCLAKMTRIHPSMTVKTDFSSICPPCCYPTMTCLHFIFIEIPDF